MTSGIYMITFISTGERYIGSSINVEKRIKQHKHGLCKNKKFTYELLELVDDFEELEKMEWLWCLKLLPELNVKIPNVQKGVGFWTFKPDLLLKGGSTPKHGEAKKQRAVWTTTEAWENLDRIADDFMISRSELIEMIGQGRLKVIRDDSKSQAA